MAPTQEVSDILSAICIIIICILIRKRRNRNVWTRRWIDRRSEHGAYHALLRELYREDQEGFKNFVRMNKASFDELLALVSPLIKRRDTVMREAISPAERLALTLRFLASGDTYQSLEYLYRISRTTISYIIPETCDAIFRVLKDTYLKFPNSANEWRDIAKEFDSKWNFPNCIGAMDGKHIMIKCPVDGGSKFYNYKHFNSIVLLALVDADYNFIFVDVGCNGRVSDGGVFARSDLHDMLENGELNFPPEEPLPGRESNMPFVIVGDDAFPLKRYLLKPYPSRNLDLTKRIFNYRLSRARRIVENVFGIMAHRFGVFQKALPLQPEVVEKIVLASCALHNFLRSQSRNVYTPPGSLDYEEPETNVLYPGEWRSENASGSLQPLAQHGANRCTNDAREIRSEFCDYFNTNGEVPWQWNMI